MIHAYKEARAHLEREHLFLLALLGTTAFFDGYDGGIIGLALTQIRETFSLDKGHASLLLAVIFAGALPALFITRAADRLGRRRLLIISVTGYTISTGLTAIAPNAATFTVCQFLSHLFLYSEGAIVWTMAAEELPAQARGLGFGLLGMMTALGVGFAAILYGGFLEPNDISWRWLYAAGVPPLILVAVLRRNLPETRRFLAVQASGALSERWHEITKPKHRRWLVLVVLAAALFQLAQQAASFAIDFLETDRGISVSTANFMLVFAGLPGIPIMVLAGSLSDRFGRRLVGCGFGLMSLLGGFGFFWLPGGVPVLLPCMSIMLIGQLGSWPVLQTYASELFPTSLRGQATAWATMFRVIGQSSSLILAAPLLHYTSQSWTATVLAVGPLLGVFLVAFKFPDTHGRELEEITDDVVLPPPVVTAIV